MTTPEIASTLARRLHFNTFGGNPVCAAGGRAVLQAVDEDGIQANAAKVGWPGHSHSGSWSVARSWSRPTYCLTVFMQPDLYVTSCQAMPWVWYNVL